MSSTRDWNCKYLSDTFLNRVWPLYSQKVAGKAKSARLNAVIMICEYLKCDFMDIDRTGAQSFFDALESGKIESKMNHRPYSQITVCLFYDYLNAIANSIVGNPKAFPDLNYSNPFTFVKVSRPSEQHRHSDVVETADIGAILSALHGTQMYWVVMFAFRLGLREMELLALTPDDVVCDKEGHIALIVRKPVRKSSNLNVYDLTKRRFVRIPDDLTDEFREFYNHIPGNSPTVFCNERRRAFTDDVFRNYFASELRKAGLQPVTLQKIRRTAKLQMLRSGATPEQIARQCGISSGRYMNQFNNILEMTANQASELVKIEMVSQ